MSFMDILNQYANPSAAQNPQAVDHFDQVAQQAAPGDIGRGLSETFRSDATPPFSQMIGSLFGRSNPMQRVAVLNQLIHAVGPAGLSSAGGGVLGRILGSGAGASSMNVSPEQASQVSPDDVAAIASHAEKHDPSIVDKLGSFYAQHPTLVKTLGGAALAVLMGNMNKNRSPGNR